MTADNVDRADIVRVLYSDLHGLSHGKYIEAAHIDHPTHYAVTVMTMGLDLGTPPSPGYGADVGYQDMEARVDVATQRPGWEPNTDVVIADLYQTDGSALAIDPRRALREALSWWEGQGLRPQAGFEMELYLLQHDASEGLQVLDVPWHRVYATGPAFDPSGLGRAIFEGCIASQIGVEGVNGEFHPGQMEVATRYRDALGAADEAFLFRELAREIALAAGKGCTFLPRPFAHCVGSGMHVNISVADATGANVFESAHQRHGLSAMARHAIAGLLAHHQAMSAFVAPTVNSYKRLMPGLFAGYWANWGLDNRFSTYRVPGQRGAATRIENRTPDATASPYLTLAVMLAAMRHGIEAELELPEPQTGDGDAAPNTDRHTPHDLASALDALEADDVIRSAVSPDLVNTFLAIKREEWGRWLAAVTDWEIKEYGRVY